MTDPPDPEGQEPLSQADLDAGERYAGPHDPGPGEAYAGEPVPDPWEEVAGGELDPGSVQQTVGQTGRSTHDVLFGDMMLLLQKAAACGDPAQVAELVVSEMNYQQIADLVVAALAAPERSTEETAAALRSALGDRASEVGRLLSA
jgi:hypothetical protein